jgi:hypothetical protein
MILSLILIEGKDVSREALRSLPLGNAKQLVIGDAEGFGAILHVTEAKAVGLANKTPIVFLLIAFVSVGF